MAYVVDRAVICDACAEPDQHYRLLRGRRLKVDDGPELTALSVLRGNLVEDAAGEARLAGF